MSESATASKLGRLASMEYTQKPYTAAETKRLMDLKSDHGDNWLLIVKLYNDEFGPMDRPRTLDGLKDKVKRETRPAVSDGSIEHVADQEQDSFLLLDPAIMESETYDTASQVGMWQEAPCLIDPTANDAFSESLGATVLDSVVSDAFFDTKLGYTSLDGIFPHFMPPNSNSFVDFTLYPFVDFTDLTSDSNPFVDFTLFGSNAFDDFTPFDSSQFVEPTPFDSAPVPFTSASLSTQADRPFPGGMRPDGSNMDHGTGNEASLWLDDCSGIGNLVGGNTGRPSIWPEEQTRCLYF